MLTPLVILIHAASVWALVGLIWFVQLVHYPLFGAVGAEGFAAYEAQHTARTTWVVAPLMLAEVVTTVALVVMMPAGIPKWLLWVGLATVLVNWGSTWALQVPQHATLSEGFDAEAHRFLVVSNWLRTAAWTAHGLIALGIVWHWARPAGGVG